MQSTAARQRRSTNPVDDVTECDGLGTIHVRRNYVEQASDSCKLHLWRCRNTSSRGKYSLGHDPEIHGSIRRYLYLYMSYIAIVLYDVVELCPFVHRTGIKA